MEPFYEPRDWKDFKNKLQGLTDRIDEKRALSDGTVPKMLFRGHSNFDWKLETTLERYAPQVTHWGQYLEIADAIRPQVETMTKQRWTPLSGWNPWCFRDAKPWRSAPPGYDYLVYLRHHGFPSPILDWTESPYIAAFFAYAPAGGQDRAIYAFLEETGEGKTGSRSQPDIHSYGPYVTSHHRHVLQKATYTSCLKLDGDRGRCFASHEEVFARGDTAQDLLWKFKLPGRLRLEVLRDLDAYNLNAFSLFQTEESLLATLALREIDFQDHEIPKL